MKLYYSKGACSLIVRIMLNEVGIESEFEAVNLKTKKTHTGQDYLSINPKGSVPALELKNGELLTENAVILQYLADVSKAIELLPPVGYFQRYRVLEWLNYVATEIHKSFGPLFNPNIPQDLKNQIFIPLLESKLDYINKHLEHHQYLLGDDFTLPDIYLFVMLTWTSHFNLDLNKRENLARYFAELNNKQSVIESLKQEG